MLNICLCGRCSNYPHTDDCPYPYYGNSDQAVIKWIDAQKKKKIKDNLNVLDRIRSIM